MSAPVRDILNMRIKPEDRRLFDWAAKAQGPRQNARRFHFGGGAPRRRGGVAGSPGRSSERQRLRCLCGAPRREAGS